MSINHSHCHVIGFRKEQPKVGATFITITAHSQIHEANPRANWALEESVSLGMKLHVCCLHTGGDMGWYNRGLCQTDSNPGLATSYPCELGWYTVSLRLVVPFRKLRMRDFPEMILSKIKSEIQHKELDKYKLTRQALSPPLPSIHFSDNHFSFLLN